MQVIIIGNSAAGLAALERFRTLDPDTPVTLISAEQGPAYSRVLLPYFLRGRTPYENLFIRRPGYYERLKVKTLFAVQVLRVDDQGSRLELSDGQSLHFDRLLVATGSRPFLPPIPGLSGPRVFHLWNLADAQALDPLFLPGRRAVVLGSGFISLQAAWAARLRGLQVTVFELLPRLMPTVLDERGAALLQKRIEEHGVRVRLGTVTEAVERDSSGTLRVVAAGQPPLETDLIIVGAGVRPNVGLLAGSSVKAEGGIPVDEGMRTNVENIFAAGDVALGPTAFGESHQTHALWPTAVEQGRIAGTNLAGGRALYRGSLNMNVTEMFGLTVASMGKFIETEGAQAWVDEPGGQSRYLKIVTRNGVAEGAVALGTAEEALILGRLRPWVRFKRRIPDLGRFVQGRYTVLPRGAAGLCLA